MMRTRARGASIGIAIASLALLIQGPGQTAQTTSAGAARLAFSHNLGHLDGTRLQAKLVEVTYAPGESSSPHTHPCPVVGYVLEGVVRMRVGNAAEVRYKAGEGFYEDANSQHLVSANASQTERARFLAYFTCDHDAPLSAPIHDAGH